MKQPFAITVVELLHSEATSLWIAMGVGARTGEDPYFHALLVGSIEAFGWPLWESMLHKVIDLWRDPAGVLCFHPAPPSSALASSFSILFHHSSNVFFSFSGATCKHIWWAESRKCYHSNAGSRGIFYSKIYSRFCFNSSNKDCKTAAHAGGIKRVLKSMRWDLQPALPHSCTFLEVLVVMIIGEGSWGL